MFTVTRPIILSLVQSFYRNIMAGKETGCLVSLPYKVTGAATTSDPSHNAQTLWMNFKVDIGDKARERAKMMVPKLKQEIAELENKLDVINGDSTLSEEEKSLASVVLVKRLAEKQKKRYKASALEAQVRHKLEGEIIGRYWTRVNKECKPRDIIHRLKISTDPEGPAQYETNSKKMATIARNYHNKLQSERADTPPEVREEKIDLEKTSTTYARNASSDKKLVGRG